MLDASKSKRNPVQTAWLIRNYTELESLRISLSEPDRMNTTAFINTSNRVFEIAEKISEAAERFYGRPLYNCSVEEWYDCEAAFAAADFQIHIEKMLVAN